MTTHNSTDEIGRAKKSAIECKGMRSARRDGIIVTFVALGFLALSYALDTFNTFHEWSHTHENWELDEIIPALFFMALCLAWFAIRRYRDLLREVRYRTAFQSELEKYQDRLEHLVSERTTDLESRNKDLSAEIAVRERMQKDLAESESRYRSLFQNMPGTFSYNRVVLDGNANPIDYVYLDVNKTFEEITGKTRGSVIGHRASEIFPELKKSKPAWINEFCQVGITGMSKRELSYFGIFGKWLDVTVFSPRPGEFVTVALDITDRKDVEDRLLLTQYAVDRAQDPILWLNQEGDTVYCNDAVSRVTGIALDRLLGMSIFDFDSELSRDEWPIVLMNLDRKGLLVRETHCRSAAGRLIPIELRMTRQTFDDNVYVFVFGRDISARKQADERLERFNSKVLAPETQEKLSKEDLQSALAAITELAAEALVVKRASIWFYSEDHSEILCVDGYDQGELAHFEDLTLRANDYPKYFDAMNQERILAADNAREDPKTAEFKEGYLDPLGITSMLDAGIRKGGKTIGVVCHEHVGEPRRWTNDEKLIAASIADLASLALESQDRKRIENELDVSQGLLQQAQKMEAVGRLAGGVAHDFNNILMVIMGHCEVLLDELDETGELHGDAEEILAATKRAASLTRQLLAFSRKQVFQAESLNVNDHVESLEKMLKRLIGEHIELRTNLNPSLQRVHADPGQIEQVIMNLAVNARDAMPEGGSLTIETANVNLDDTFVHSHPEVAPGPHVMLAVTDTGTGMDAETKALIFEPFFTTKGRDQGTGLGLSTVYGIVRQSGGTIWVYSEIDHGTTFKIFLPGIEKSGKAVKSAESQRAEGGSETILVIEDDDTVRRITANLLRRHGHTVLEAASGEDAILLAAHHSDIDLVLTDLVMPGMNGREVAEKVRELRKDIPVVYMSGYTDDMAVRKQVLSSGASFLQKPFSTEDLLGKVRKVLDESLVGN